MSPTRPPPLQLRVDNMLPGMGVSAHAPRTFFSHVYEVDWRNVIVALSLINTIRYFVFAQSAFEDEAVDAAASLSDLAHVSFILGVIYSLTCMVEVIGLFSAVMRNPLLIRLYAYLSFLNAVLVSLAGVVTCFSYFLFANDVVKECVLLASEGRLEDKSTFRGYSWKQPAALSMANAEKHCMSTYDLESPTLVLSSFLFYLLPATLHYLIVYTYYCQTVDPYHPSNMLSYYGRGRRSAIQMEALANSPLYHGQSAYSDDPVATHLKSRSSTPSYALSPGPPSYNFKPLGTYGGIAEGMFALGSAGSVTTSGLSGAT